MSAPRDFQSQQSISDMDFFFDDWEGNESPFPHQAPVDQPQNTFASAEVVPANAQNSLPLPPANEHPTFHQAVNPAFDGADIDWNHWLNFEESESGAFASASDS